MKISAEAIRQMDHSAIQDYAIPSLLLMENAGRSVSDIISRDYKPCAVLIFVGKGNNGGDGLVAARHLSNRGFSVQIALFEDPSRLKGDALLNFTIAGKMNIPRILMAGLSEKKISGYCQVPSLVVDAIFGIGLQRPVQGIFEQVIRTINKSKKPVVSIDVPSGLDADTGQVHGVAIYAAKTVTLSLPKCGLFEGEGPRYSGAIEVADIGIPRELLLPYLNLPRDGKKNRPFRGDRN